MTDYISREAAFKEFAEFVWPSNNSDFADVPTWNDAVSLIGSLPAADVVPVVRCADCKYLNEDLAIGEWDGSCRYWNTHSVSYSWFCSQGERRAKMDGGADNG